MDVVESVWLLASTLFSLGVRVFLFWFFCFVMYTIVQSVVKERVKTAAEDALRRMGLAAHVDVRFNHESVFTEVAKAGVLGLGETFVAGFWAPGEATLEDVLVRLVSAKSGAARRRFFDCRDVWIVSTFGAYFEFPKACYVRMLRKRRNNRRTSLEMNRLFELSLDSKRLLSSGLWGNGDGDGEGSSSLEDAQLRRLESLAAKLGVADGRAAAVADVGCGWGGLALSLAEEYGNVSVAASDDDAVRVEWAERRARDLNISDGDGGKPRVRFVCGAWNSVLAPAAADGTYDAVVACGVVERVGTRSFFDAASRSLKPGGVLVVQSFTSPPQTDDNADDDDGGDISTADPWIDNYVCPGFRVPTLGSLTSGEHVVGGGFVVDSVQNLRTDCRKTVAAWKARFAKATAETNETTSSDEQTEESNLKLSDEVKRLWEFSLTYIWALLESQKVGVHEIVYVRRGGETRAS